MTDQLYRHFDKNDKLLYIGISLSTVQRLGQHKHHSGWFKRIARVEIENYSTREEAVQAEREAIQKENPECNIMLKKAPKNYNAEKSKFQLTRQIVFSPLYSIAQTASMFGISEDRIKEFIDNDILSTLTVGYTNYRRSKSEPVEKKPVIRITGWAVIDLMQILESRNSK